MHLEEKAAEIVDLFARLGGCWSTLSTPPRYGPATSVGWRVDAHVYATIALVKTMGVRVLVQYTMLGK